jgi:hypothetical protein
MTFCCKAGPRGLPLSPPQQFLMQNPLFLDRNTPHDAKQFGAVCKGCGELVEAHAQHLPTPANI